MSFLIGWYVHPTYFPVLMLCCCDKFPLWNTVFYSANQLSCWRNLSKKISYSNSNHRFYKSKRKAYVYSACSILSLMKSGAPFFSIDIMYTIYLDVKYFSVVYLSILETCCKNYAYNDGTFLRKKVKLLSVRQFVIQLH